MELATMTRTEVYLTHINKRFFQALDALMQNGKIVSLTAFCDRYQYSRSKYSRLRGKTLLPTKEIDYKSVDATAIGYLIKDYGVSADWIFMGKGAMFSPILRSSAD